MNVHCENWNQNKHTLESSLDIRVSENFGLLKTRAWNFNNLEHKCAKKMQLRLWVLDFPEFKSDGTDDFISPATQLDLNTKRVGHVTFGLDICLMIDINFGETIANSSYW